MKNKNLVLGLGIFLALLIAAFATVFILTRPDLQKGTKEIGVTVVFADKTEKKYIINTDAEFLADALLEEKIINQKSKDGLYTVIAGERADYNLDKSWWCLTVDGEISNFGLNDQVISDGDNFEITNTPS